MTSSNVLDAVLYYFFHFIYLGNPSEVLSRLWLAHDIAHGNAGLEKALGENRADQAWRMFDSSMRESYRAIGTLAGLLAGAISGLSSIDAYRADVGIRTLLLVGLTSSIISASWCLSMLSNVSLHQVNIEHHWKSSGIIYIIALSGPSAWLSIALWTFQAAILAIVWLKESLPAKVIVTFCIGLRILLRVAGQLYTITPVNSRLSDFVLGLLGRRQGMSHHMVNLNKESIKKREEYLRILGIAVGKGPLTDPIPLSVFTNLERQNFFRGIDEPDDLDRRSS